MKKHFIVFVFFLVVGLFNIYGQADCRNALPVCVDAYSDGAVSGIGNVDDFLPESVSGCLGAAGAGTVESNSYWFRIKLTQSGQFGFDIIPNDPSEDWDFAVYGPNAICGQLPDPIKCNKIQLGGTTGVGNASASTLYESWMNVSSGDEYLILVNQFSGANAGFNIKWTGSIFSGVNSVLDCTIQVDLGPDFTLCDNDYVFPWLSALTFGNGNTVTYEWLKKNNVTNLWESWNPSGNAPYERQVTQAGNYSVNVRITHPVTGNLIDSFHNEIVVTSVPSPTAHPLEDDVYGCDDGTGNFNFDLEALSAKIIGTQNGVTVTYHEFLEFAKLGSDPQTSLYRSSGTKTIWARIENSAGCFDITSFEIIVVPTPIAYEPAPLIFCDTDADGKYLFNLEERTNDILGGQTGLIVTYYTRQDDAELAKFEIYNPAISYPSTAPPPALFATTDAYLSRSGKIWARVEPVLGSGCFALTSFDLEVVAPAVANPTENFIHCDADNDGLHQFDLNALKDADIFGTQSTLIYEVNYFAEQADADNNTNLLPNPYTNVTPYAPQRIYARIQAKDSPDCFDITSFTLQVLDTPYPALPANIPNLSYCDDASDGDDANGFYEFDLTERENVILNGQSPYVFEVNYYEDAAYTNQISNPAAYTNSVAHQQTVYVRVANKNINNVDCNADTSFIVEVKPLPIALIIPYELVQCDEDGMPDGIVNFNLAEADFFVTIGDSNLNVTYHLSATDAASDINELSKSSFSNKISSVVFARVSSANGCFRIVQVNLSVSVTSFPASYPGHEIEVCDDDDTIDGLHEFNLAQVTSEIISLFPSPNLRVSYFRNQADALSETNIISPANAYLSEVPFSQTIWVRVESAINGNCFGIAPVIQLTVNPRPEFELDETAIICLNDLRKIISTYNPRGIYSYEWTDDAGNTISDRPFAEISKAGVYTVMATSNLNCVSFPKQITITESIIANISSDDIQIINNSGNNSISINNANQNLGIGDYEFALDDISGPYQDSPVFTEVIPGKHIIYVNDKNNCGIAQVTVYVFGFPNFFTPNDDGQNDTWNVLGVDPSVFKASTIFIFDRYGKLMAKFSASQTGWNGFYNGNKAVSTDYWYLAKMTDYNDVTSEYKGHFSLIRR
ncbi:MAG: T9SS type B sorting domain-containing protein [Lutibacter sp.]|nr:T9SS type B sorting domain-containing protein [Lutibacter sp.]